MAREAVETAISTRPRVALEMCPRPRVVHEERMPGKLAHDLLGIATIIRGYAELMPLAQSKQLREEYSLKILRACGRMVDLVDSALTLGRQESDGRVLNKQTVDLAAFLADCLTAQTINAEKKGTVLSLEVDVELSMVSIDSRSVERILSNLIENAIKFSHPMSTIKLTARVRADSLEIEVKDNGPGIPAQELATLFDAYQTGSTRPTGGERSTGLGLSIVKELVEAQHGVVGVQSVVGHGSTFSVRLPLDRPDLPAEGQRAPQHRGEPTQPDRRAASVPRLTFRPAGTAPRIFRFPPAPWMVGCGGLQRIGSIAPPDGRPVT